MSKKSASQSGFTTRQLHAGQQPDPATNASAVPIYQTCSYVFESTQRAAQLFSHEEEGNIYTRIMNPTNEVLEERLADLEGGSGAIAASSGHAAQAMAVLTLCGAGDHIVAATTLYGGTISQFHHTFPRLGIETTFVNPDNPENFRQAIQPNTRLVWGETLGNPRINVFPFEAVSEITREQGIPLVIDNTFATPYLCRPFEWGANIVVHSTTKFISGHGTTMGGIVVDGGNFDWAASERFPEFTTPDPGNQGLVYSDYAEEAFITKARSQILRDLGACQAPFNAWLTLQGVQTLSLRMDRHVANAQKVADYLESHPGVEWVSYPGLTSHPSYQRSQRYLPLGPGGILGFGIKGGRDKGEQFIDSLKLITHLANVGDTHSLAIHPASTTHSQLSKEQLTSAGISPNYIRLSIGLEDIADILKDLEQALS